MRTHTPYRLLLPVIQTVAAIVFGGVGLWERHAILNRPLFGDQTLWDSTARFHVWPLPYRLAVISNIPAFVTAGIVEWPLSAIWPRMPETVGFVLFVGCVPILWYFLGQRLDRVPAANRQSRKVLLSFAVLSIAAIFTPGYIGYLYSGSLLWVAFAVLVSRVRRTA